MKLNKLVWACLSLALLACPKPQPAGECGGFTCTDGQRCESSTLTCVPDAPPVITLVKPSAVVTTPTFELTGTITDDLAVTSAEWQSGVLPWQQIQLGNDGTFTLTLESPLVDSETTVINVRANDAVVQVTAAAQVKVDRIGPSLKLTAPASSAVVNAATVDVTVEPGDGSGSLGDFTIGGTAITAPRSGVAATVTLPVPAALDRQIFSVEATAADLLGNRTTQTFSIVVDNVAPTVSFFAPAANAVVNTASFTADVLVDDRSAIQSAVFHFSGATFVGTDAGGGHWTCDLLTSAEEADEVISVEVTDQAGNVGTVSRTVHVDRIGPTVTVTAPVAGSTFRTNIAVAATTGPGANSVTATLEGQTVMLTGGPTAWTGTLTVPQRDFSSATVHVTASDTAGNSASSDVVINVDTVAPVIAFTTPTANQKFNASAFTSSPNVNVTWTVTDADSQAATTTVNGAPSTALTTSVATNASDNPANYTSTVVAADRAGNTTTASVSYSVDRVVPTVSIWTPANGTRNFDSHVSGLTFSEPVSGPLPSSPALMLAGQAPTVDFWYPGHAQYEATIDAFHGQVIDLSLANLADAYGNPVAAASHRIHVATSIPSGTIVASGVSSFAASSDSDGAITVAYLKTNGQLAILRDVEGTLVTLDRPVSGTRVGVSSWNTVDPVTLRSSQSFGVSVYDAAVPAAARYTHLQWAALSGGGIITFLASPAGAVISRPPLNREPDATLTGYVIGTTYTRGALSRTLPTPADMVVAQSNDSWAVATVAGSLTHWSRYRCNRDTRLFPGPDTYTCAGTEYGGSMSLVPDFVEAAMTRSGSCLAINVRAPNGPANWYGAFFQPLENCDGSYGVSPPASCNPNTNIPVVSGYVGQKIAPFAANGEDTILFAFPAGTGNPAQYRLEKMTPGACGFSTSATPPFAAYNVRDFAPIQVGTRPGFIFVDTNNDLRVLTP